MGSGAATAKRAVAAGVVGLAAVPLALPVVAAPTVLLSSTGCAGSDCVGGTATFGSCTEGELVPGRTDMWESGPICGTPYLDDHGERTWIFDPTPWMGTREPNNVLAYLSLQPDTCGDAGSFAQPAGNLAEYNLIPTPTGWRVSVLNDTCAQYYVRVVVLYGDDAGDASRGTCQAADGGSASGG